MHPCFQHAPLSSSSSSSLDQIHTIAAHAPTNQPSPLFFFYPASTIPPALALDAEPFAGARLLPELRPSLAHHHHHQLDTRSRTDAVRLAETRPIELTWRSHRSNRQCCGQSTYFPAPTFLLEQVNAVLNIYHHHHKPTLSNYPVGHLCSRCCCLLPGLGVVPSFHSSSLSSWLFQRAYTQKVLFCFSPYSPTCWVPFKTFSSL
jgi:hypothetical protein